jgi:hypothetical protein
MQDIYQNINLGKDYHVKVNSTVPDPLGDDYASVEGGKVTDALRNIGGRITYGPKNKKVGEFSAQILKYDDKLAVIDPYVELKKEFKGKGIGKEFTTQSMALLKKMGVKTVSIDAGMTDGGYAWAKAGFKFARYPNSLVNRMEILNGIIKDKELNAMIKTFSKGKGSFKGPFNFEPADLLKLGKLSDRKTDKQLANIVESFEGYKDLGVLGDTIEQFPIHPSVEWFKTHNLGEFILRGARYQGIKKLAKGGLVPKYFANGGYARGGDVVPAMLTPGEFVVKKPAADRIGASALSGINNGNLPAASGDSVYNTYSINISVNSNSNAQDIANTVLNSIKRVDNQRIRSTRI